MIKGLKNLLFDVEFFVSLFALFYLILFILILLTLFFFKFQLVFYLI